MSEQSRRDVTERDRELAWTSAVGLAVWLSITLGVVALLLVLGPTLSGLFV